MKVILAFAAGALLVPAIAQAATSSSEATTNATRQCRALRVEIGSSTFEATFSSFAGCVSKLTPLEQQNTAAADTLCHVPLPAAGSPSRVFESCVVTFARSASLTEQQSLDPAHTCISLRSSIGTAAFASRYGSGGNAANAYGKCVSTTTGAQLAVETSSASTCRAEQETAGFASAHGGKTFAQVYGTNAADSNAFGRCVSLEATAQTTSQAGQTSTSTQEQQSTPQPSSTTTITTTTPTSTVACTGGGATSSLMPNDCLPAGPRGGLR